jgi:hypothetical protein
LRRFLPNTGAETPSAIGEDGGVSEQRRDPLVAPTMHREQVVGDFDVEEHLAVQRVVHAAGRALTELIDTERLYRSVGNRSVVAAGGCQCQGWLVGKLCLSRS